MSRDVKTGMLIGLVLVIIGLIVISIWPGGGVEDRLLKDAGKRTVQPVLGGVVGGDSNDPDDSAGKVADEEDDSSQLPLQPVEPPGKPNEDIRKVAEQVVEEFDNPPIDTTPRVHIVAENESLSSIAKLHYGDANKWHLIANANKGVIKNVDKLSLGMRLVIPKP